MPIWLFILFALLNVALGFATARCLAGAGAKIRLPRLRLPAGLIFWRRDKDEGTAAG